MNNDPFLLEHKHWQVHHHQDSLDSARDTIEIRDDSEAANNHPQGPLTIADFNVRAFAPRVEEIAAYAHLMAAAPQLLRALDDCRGVLQSIEDKLNGRSFAVVDVLRKAREAISQARHG